MIRRAALAIAACAGDPFKAATDALGGRSDGDRGSVRIVLGLQDAASGDGGAAAANAPASIVP